MARKIFRRVFPSPRDIKKHRALNFLGDLLHDPNLLHLNRHSVSVAFFWGLFIAMLPIPGQMAVSACAAVAFRCNLPICVALAWITNPLTMVFFFYIAYEMGTLVLGIDGGAVATIATIKAINFSDFWDLVLDNQYDAVFSWLGEQVGKFWKPFLVGSIISGLLFGAMGYSIVQWYWRWHVAHRWEKRKQRNM